MTALERAQTYAAIWLTMGKRWRSYLPRDVRVRGDVVELDGVHMRRVGDSWELTEHGRRCVVRLRDGARV